MKECRDCQHVVSEQALACPNCGCPYPAKEKWNGWGYEYKSRTKLLGLPLVHISFKYTPDRSPVPATGIIAIGQFAIGVFTISQFGLGVISISQFAIAAFAVAQFAVAYSLIAQLGLFFGSGYGQVVRNILELIGNS
jgi:hypothetical protein